MASDELSQIGTCPACRTENITLKAVNGLYICENCSSKRFSNKVRKSIQEAFEKQEEQRRKESWVKRLDIAKKGVKYYEDGRLPEALKTFRDYLAILETRYKVPPGYLQVGLFNKKEDAGEILLIAGIMWDMAKIYDQKKGNQAEVRRYLNKFVEFSIDKPHMIMSSEAIRRYINSGAAKNIKEFKDAHTYIQSHLSKCFIATVVYGHESVEVKVLQQFRDQVLTQNILGKSLIKLYYFFSPSLAKIMIRLTSEDPFGSRVVNLTRFLLDRIVWKLMNKRS